MEKTIKFQRSEISKRIHRLLDNGKVHAATILFHKEFKIFTPYNVKRIQIAINNKCAKLI